MLFNFLNISGISEPILVLVSLFLVLSVVVFGLPIYFSINSNKSPFLFNVFEVSSKNLYKESLLLFFIRDFITSLSSFISILFWDEAGVLFWPTAVAVLSSFTSTLRSEETVFNPLLIDCKPLSIPASSILNT